MLNPKLNQLKSWADGQISNYFPLVRGAVLLIVVPAFIIVIAYFYNIVSEVVTGKKYHPVLEYEKRLAAVKIDLPAAAVVNYVSDSEEQGDLINAAYVLIPVRVVGGLKPRHDLLIYQSFNTAEKPKFEGYTLKKNYGNGVILYNRNN